MLSSIFVVLAALPLEDTHFAKTAKVHYSRIPTVYFRIMLTLQNSAFLEIFEAGLPIGARRVWRAVTVIPSSA